MADFKINPIVNEIFEYNLESTEKHACTVYRCIKGKQYNVLIVNEVFINAYLTSNTRIFYFLK